jgi:2-polyprenyl-6-hydroxyphenyl methylase/3-demethylubiquinone-9 3-methyltransferase
MTSTDLTAAHTHFAFGRNWAAYAERIGETHIAEAVAGLSRLLGGARLDGRTFLDIGSGSGIHSVAALRLGASRVLALDIDVDSVGTTRAVLARHAPQSAWEVQQRSVFDLTPADPGYFDVVYSWGVLHHTGDLSGAMRQAAALCGTNGKFVFALYRRVWMDWFWRREKRWYAQASAVAQRRARLLYISLYRAGLRLTLRNPRAYFDAYLKNRGMLFEHDVHDWLGGWPYESILPREVDALLTPLGLRRERAFVSTGRLFGRRSGVFGSGCDEYVYTRPER